MYAPVPSTVDRVTTTFLARVAAAEVEFISTHTATAEPPSTAVAEAGSEKDTADSEEGMICKWEQIKVRIQHTIIVCDNYSCGILSQTNTASRSKSRCVQ